MTCVHKMSQACQFDIGRLSFMTVLVGELISVRSDSLPLRNDGCNWNLWFQGFKLFAS